MTVVGVNVALVVEGALGAMIVYSALLVVFNPKGRRRVVLVASVVWTLLALLLLLMVSNLDPWIIVLVALLSIALIGAAGALLSVVLRRSIPVRRART